MKKYLIDDAEYFVRGRGVGPMMVFAHGFPFDGAIFDDVVERLSEKFYCVVPDLRGFGASTLGANGRNPSGFPRVTMGRYADDLTILSSVVACERRMDPQATKIFICGLSMGGYIALSMAKRRIERLAGIVFCDSNVVADSPEKAQQRLELADKVDVFTVQTLAETTPNDLLSPNTLARRPDVVEKLRQTIKRQSPSAVAAGSRGMARRDDSTNLLPSITVPTLVLGGADDKLSPPSALDAVAAALPNATRATIPDAGHVPSMENPAAFADAILKWREENFDF